MAFFRKLGHTVLYLSVTHYGYSRMGFILHHTAQYQSMLCYAVTYNAALCYKRLCHTNQSTWLQGHQSANQLASHWRARLHGKHSFLPSLPPPCHGFFFLSVCFISNHEAIWKRKQGKMHLFTHSSQSLEKGEKEKDAKTGIRRGRKESGIETDNIGK